MGTRSGPGSPPVGASPSGAGTASNTLEARILREGQRQVMEELETQGKVWRSGAIWSFTLEEHEQLETFRSLIAGYIQLISPPRPLCLAVFGPPGSGKSYAVREICKDLGTATGKHLDLTEVNLTVLASQSDLVGLLRELRRHRSKSAIPVVFFDEFDAPLNGVPLGWLSRFLAPMQDGTLFDDGEEFDLKQAVYIFAGGTAARMADFGASSSQFREAKGPDFVSRLRGYIDVTGPNEPTSTSLRRAVIMRAALEDIAKARGSGDPPQLSDRLREAMLYVGRFRHGARSIKAIIEMSAATASTGAVLDLDHLPPDYVLNVHRDLGQLDPTSIGGLIGLSAGPDDTDVRCQGWKDISVAIAAELWKVGAVVAYGGRWDANLTEDLLGELSKHADALVTATSALTRDPHRAQARVEVFARHRPSTPIERLGMTPVPVPAWRDVNENLEKALTAFRMRWTMSCRCVARILVGGKTSEYSGRMPGILEETVLALAQGQPLYIVGGLGGGAEVVGELLGLARKWPNSRDAGSFGARAKTSDELDCALAAASSLIRPAGFANLPITFPDAISFVTGFSLGSSNWPPNGLTLDENRKLFEAEAKDAKLIVELVTQGLKRQFTG